jgi:hypothetical protein
LIANIRRHPQNSLVLSCFILAATSGIVLFSGVSVNTTYNGNQAQAQTQDQQQQQQLQQSQVGQTSITILWETPDDLKNPESVVYAPKQNVLYVSNIDGKPDQKDQNGFISKISPSNGSIVELNWITGLNAPKGMAIYNNNSSSRLYVSDITDLVEIDIGSGKIIKRFNAPGSVFLNDVALDNQGIYLIQLQILSTN